MNIISPVCPRPSSVGLALLLALVLTTHLFGFSKSGTVYTTDGSQADVNAAVVDANPGDMVNMPAGTFTWGTGGFGIVLNKSITLSGAGQGVTTINQTSDSAGLIYIQGGPAITNAVVQRFTVNQNNQRVFFCGGVDGWRFTDLEVVGNSTRLWDIDSAYGLIDNCKITMPNEQIFMYGKAGAWNAPAQFGTDQAVYIEDCVFYGGGYTDANANGQMVMRFNTITDTMKFDSHGVWSDSPNFSARYIEVYYNLWTSIGQSGFWPTIEFRGGTGRFFFNSALDNTFGGRGILKPQEYGAITLGGYFPRYQGPDDYPIFEQVGTGVAGAPEPVYLWGNRKGGIYPNGGVMPSIANWTSIPPQAISEYQARIGNPSATYTMDDIIKVDRDYFGEPYAGYGTSSEPGGGVTGAVAVAFDGSTGTGMGTKATMLGITPTKAGVGFWVTDEGKWNYRHSGPDGQLYVWNGSAWILNYIPFRYPHPLRTPNSPSGLEKLK